MAATLAIEDNKVVLRFNGSIPDEKAIGWIQNNRHIKEDFERLISDPDQPGHCTGIMLKPRAEGYDEKETYQLCTILHMANDYLASKHSQKVTTVSR